MSVQEKADSLIETLKAKVAAKPQGSANWGGYIIINFTDADDAYLLKFAMDGTVEKVETGLIKMLQKKNLAKATIITTTDTIESTFDGTVGGMAAMMSGAIKIDGSQADVMKLSAAFM
jgi:putative sterol carrier protein